MTSIGVTNVPCYVCDWSICFGALSSFAPDHHLDAQIDRHLYGVRTTKWQLSNNHPKGTQACANLASFLRMGWLFL
jgi:hypothetical protein